MSDQGHVQRRQKLHGQHITAVAVNGYDPTEFVPDCHQMNSCRMLRTTKRGGGTGSDRAKRWLGEVSTEQKTHRAASAGPSPSGEAQEVMARGLMRVDQAIVLTMAASKLVRVRTFGCNETGYYFSRRRGALLRGK